MENHIEYLKAGLNPDQPLPDMNTKQGIVENEVNHAMKELLSFSVAGFDLRMTVIRALARGLGTALGTLTFFGDEVDVDEVHRVANELTDRLRKDLQHLVVQRRRPE